MQSVRRLPPRPSRPRCALRQTFQIRALSSSAPSRGDGDSDGGDLSISPNLVDYVPQETQLVRYHKGHSKHIKYPDKLVRSSPYASATRIQPGGGRRGTAAVTDGNWGYRSRDTFNLDNASFPLGLRYPGLEKDGQAAIAELERLDEEEIRRTGRRRDITGGKWRQLHSERDAKTGEIKFTAENGRIMQWQRAIIELQARQRQVSDPPAPEPEGEGKHIEGENPLTLDPASTHAKRALKYLEAWDNAAIAAGVTNVRNLDVGKGLWRHDWNEADAISGRPMDTIARLRRQHSRAAIELASRRKFGRGPPIEANLGPAPESWTSVQEADSQEDAQKESRQTASPTSTQTQLLTSDLVGQIVKDTNAAVMRQAQDVDNNMVRQNANGPNTAVTAKSQDATNDFISQVTKETSASLAANPFMPGMISEIAKRIADQVRMQLWQDLKASGPDISMAKTLYQPVQAEPVFTAPTEHRNREVAKELEQERQSRDEHTSDIDYRSLSGFKADPSAEQADTSQFSIIRRVSSGAKETEAPEETGYRSAVVADEPIQRSSGKQLSLVEELFPDKPKEGKDPVVPDREVPRLRLYPERRTLNVNNVKHLSTTSRHQAALQRHNEFEQLGQDPTILLLRNGSTSLVEDDFRRLIPKGKHIEEWQGNGKYIKVIPGRDLRTMQRTNHYYILFPSQKSAQVYQNSVGRAHRAARKHTQSSFESAIPPPPGFLTGGEDTDELRKAFSLIPISQDLQINIMTQPYHPKLKQMMVTGQLPIIAEIPHKHRVLLTVEGIGQHTSELRQYIRLVGKERGLAYELVEAADAVKQLKLSRNRALDRKEEVNESVDDTEESDHSDATNLDFADEDGAGRSPTQAWVISFVSEAEAKRFARTSHGRRFPIFSKAALPHERPGKMAAEYLW